MKSVGKDESRERSHQFVDGMGGNSGSGTSRCGALPASGFSIHCEGVSRHFEATKAGTIAALDNVSFSVWPHQFVCIVGPSGCGKSTLLRIIAGLIAPTTGSVRFDGEPGNHNGLPATDLVFQEFGTFPWLTVLDNVAFGLEVAGVSRGERRDRAAAFAERVGLASFLDRYPHELSVGQRQRVGVARAFVSGAPGLLMDEPFSSLDAQTGWILREQLQRLWREDRKLILYVTHDIEEAVLLGDRVLVMTGRPGRIREDIPIALARPRDPASSHREVAEIKQHIWSLLEDDVRSSLRGTP